jgi:hypothetical protein
MYRFLDTEEPCPQPKHEHYIKAYAGTGGKGSTMYLVRNAPNAIKVSHGALDYEQTANGCAETHMINNTILANHKITGGIQ